jgi:hypothetical protein
MGRQNGDLRLVTVEVFSVESEDLADSVGLHCGNVDGVVSFFARDLVLSDQALPVLMHIGRVRDEGGKLLEIPEVLGGLVGAHPETILIAWTRCNDPKLPLSLGCQEKFFPPLQADFDSFSGRLVLRVIPYGQAAEDIGVNEDGHGPRRASIVYGLATRINWRTGTSGNSGHPGAKPPEPFFWGM